jgi:hypothetical protein
VVYRIDERRRTIYVLPCDFAVMSMGLGSQRALLAGIFDSIRTFVHLLGQLSNPDDDA